MVPLPPKTNFENKSKVNKGKSVKESKTKAFHIIGSKEFKREVEEATIFTLVTKEATLESASECPLEVELILRKFQDMFLEDLPDELPPMHDIQHVIDLIPEANFPYLPHYQMNPIEHLELRKKIDELMRKGFIKGKHEPMCHACTSHTQEGWIMQNVWIVEPLIKSQHCHSQIFLFVTTVWRPDHCQTKASLTTV